MYLWSLCFKIRTICLLDSDTEKYCSTLKKRDPTPQISAMLLLEGNKYVSKTFEVPGFVKCILLEWEQRIDALGLCNQSHITSALIVRSPTPCQFLLLILCSQSWGTGIDDSSWGSSRPALYKGTLLLRQLTTCAI